MLIVLATGFTIYIGGVRRSFVDHCCTCASCRDVCAVRKDWNYPEHAEPRVRTQVRHGLLLWRVAEAQVWSV